MTPLRARALSVAIMLGCAVSGPLASRAAAQPAVPNPATAQEQPPAAASDTLSLGDGSIGVNAVTRDEAIRERLQRILEATGWFTAPRVRVDEGVAFISGEAASSALRTWAGDLARNTEGVVAVVNRIEVVRPSAWDFAGAQAGLTTLWHDTIRAIPLLLLGLMILVLSALAGGFTARRMRRVLATRVKARLLRGVVAWGLGVLVFLIGTYVVLRVAGLTQLALTLVGGTGLLGLVIGIAFRDITENFLASIFLSVQRPFEMGDLVEIADITGYVEQLNVRTTVLMTLDGNLVQVPNSTIYKGVLTNYTVNPNRRESFVVGIGYDDSIDDAQEVAREVLANHPAVLDDPEPWVLADDLGKATVNLKIYFWLDGRTHSWLKVRSSVIRLIKRAFQERGISMPDEAREILFPQGVPVTIVRDGDAAATTPPVSDAAAAAGETKAVSTRAEGGLESEAGTLRAQARQAKPLGDVENLLDSTPEKPA